MPTLDEHVERLVGDSVDGASIHNLTGQKLAPSDSAGLGVLGKEVQGILNKLDSSTEDFALTIANDECRVVSGKRDAVVVAESKDWGYCASKSAKLVVIARYDKGAGFDNCKQKVICVKTCLEEAGL